MSTVEKGGCALHTIHTPHTTLSFVCPYYHHKKSAVAMERKKQVDVNGVKGEEGEALVLVDSPTNHQMANNFHLNANMVINSTHPLIASFREKVFRTAE
jgi:hypothetical protein